VTGAGYALEVSEANSDGGSPPPGVAPGGTTCPVCGATVKQRGYGRPRRQCSDACTWAAVRLRRRDRDLERLRAVRADLEPGAMPWDAPEPVFLAEALGWSVAKVARLLRELPPQEEELLRPRVNP
jgi:predicted nucleic acid-binding Zn ribbon protein